VAVTGLGLVSALGQDPSALWSALADARSAVGPIRRFDASSYPTRIAAEVHTLTDSSGRDVTPGADRIAAFAHSACAAALEDANDDAGVSENRERHGLVLAAGLDNYRHDELFAPLAAATRSDGSLELRALATELHRSLGPDALERRSPGTLAADLARRHRLRGDLSCIDTACAAGTHVIGQAARWIRRGAADVVVAVASDSQLSPLGLASFCLLRALSTRNEEPERASRPFDALRDGFVLGEGAGALVLEDYGRAERRGARIHAEIAGFGAACDAYRATDPHPEGRGAIRAMQSALDDACIGPGEVAYVNAHGTSTVANDRIETRALRAVFGRSAENLTVSSTKSYIGHLTIAAGAVEAIATVLSLRHQAVHPTLNLQQPDPECDLDYVPEGMRPLDFEVALSNSFAFGGQCSSLVLRRYGG
jgi:3-oxoacyl-[acyl-carrier-protein] synthase II